jgi:hypothetical protein
MIGKAYIAGPMRGLPSFNFPAFFAVEAALAHTGVEFFNPARNDCEMYGLDGDLDGGLSAGQWLIDNPQEFDLRGALAADMKFIAEEADAIILLPGWEGSKGAIAERALSDALGHEVLYWHPDTGQALSEPYGASSQAQDAIPGLAEGEVRATSATGGQKGVKMAAFDQISPQIEWEVAEHFGAGALKYDAHNFRRGYPWSQSYSALRRHLADFWSGKVFDTCPEDAHGCKFPEGFTPVRPNTCFNHTGSRHIVAVIWHAMALAEFSRFEQFKEYDDRYVYDR